MSKILTAEEFINQWGKDKYYYGIEEYKDIDKMMIEFAKLHVKAALEAAKNSYNFALSDSLEDWRHQHILNSYPETNII